MPPRTPVRLLRIENQQLLRNRYRRTFHGSARVSDYFPRGPCRTCGSPNNANSERRRGSRFVDDKARVTDSSGERFGGPGGGFVGGAFIPQQWWCVGVGASLNLVKNSVSTAVPVGAENFAERSPPQRLRRLKSFTATTRNWIFNRRDNITPGESESRDLGLKTKRSFSSASKMAFHGTCLRSCGGWVGLFASPDELE